MKIKFLDGTERETANLSDADLRDADLSYANLRYADLSDADLSYADLSDADLYGANLRYADLSYADLRYANLHGADLRGANLSDADLRGANLSYANLPENFRIARLDFGGWSVCVLADKTSIGCQTHANELWLKADPRWITAQDPKATEWWTRYGAVVQAAIKAVQS